MENKKCKYCGTEMDTEAKICPNCKKKQKTSVGKIILIVVLVLIVLVALSSGDSSNTNTTADSDSSNTTATENTSSSSSSETKTEYSVGETYSSSSIKVTYTSADANFVGYWQYATIKDGYKVIAATFEFENLGTTDKTVAYWDFECYADGYSCDAFYSVEDSAFSATLSSGKKANGTVYFEVPQDATDVTIEYDDNVWTSSKVVFRVI